MSQLGNITLYLTVFLSAWAGALALVGAQRRSRALVDSAVVVVYAVAAVCTLSMLLLIYSFVISDFSISYVHQHVDRSMPLFYRITGVWGGMEGSLLLWVWLQTLVTAFAVRANIHRLRELLPYSVAVWMLVVLFFGVIVVAHSNPFATYLTMTPGIGRGLNPLLQNPYMVTHPPSLYLGFVALSIPFGLAIGALLSGQLDDSWIHASRPWALLSWFFLSLGLTLGMLWAYEELGWGGYWGWDPVENAGFMPWLLCTAYIHSIMVQERRQMLKRWNILLAALGFVMTIFGTFLTRSGFIQSVHAFARSNVGYVFLAFIGVVLVCTLTLLMYRKRALASRGSLESVLSREFWFLLNNWVLLSAAILVMVLTVFPNISEAFGEKITISIPAFNRWMVPIGLVLLVITGVGPMLGWRKSTTEGLRQQFLWPLVVGAITTGVLIAFRVPYGRAIAAWALSAFVTATIVQEIFRGAVLRARASKIGFFSALVGLFARNRRRYGGYVVHFGIVLMCVGFAGEAYKQEIEVMMTKGQQVPFGRYVLRYDGLNVSRDNQKTMLTATLTAFIDKKPVAVLSPARWIFERHKNSPTTEVSILRSWGDDLFLAVGDLDTQRGTATLKLVINPLVNWIWIGFLVLMVGTVIAGWPTGRRAARARAGASKAGALAVVALLLLSPPGWANTTEGADHSPAKGPILLTGDGPRELALFARISCMCGTCPKIPLGSCGCGFAQRERSVIREKLRAGWSDERLIAWYTKERGAEIGREPFGATALAVPPDTAFNRLAWLVPYAVSLGAIGFLAFAGRRWKGRGANAKPEPERIASAGEEANRQTYKELLDRELDRLE